MARVWYKRFKNQQAQFKAEIQYPEGGGVSLEEREEQFNAVKFGLKSGLGEQGV